MSDRRGFTLVELMVVAIVGSLVVLAAYQVLITNQRTYTAQSAQVQSQQQARAAMDILFNELREVSSAGGDIVDAGPIFIEVRTMRSVGVVCDTYTGLFALTPQLLVRRVGDWFEPGDSVFIFADNDEYMTSDDTWIRGRTGTVDTTRTCAGGHPAQLITFPAQALNFVADTVRDGAPIRNYTRYRYSLASYDGETYLGRAEAGGNWEPMVGPLTGLGGAPGIFFRYYDAAGNETAVLADIVRVDVIVRAQSFARDADGDLVGDSIKTSVYMRN